jgi:hypothetical protein
MRVLAILALAALLVNCNGDRIKQSKIAPSAKPRAEIAHLDTTLAGQSTRSISRISSAARWCRGGCYRLG